MLDSRTVLPVDSTPSAMDNDLETHSSRHKRSHKKDPDHKSRKRRKREDHESSGRKCKRKDEEHDNKERDKLHITDDDPDDEDMWVEKNIDMDGERVSVLSIVLREAVLSTCSI
jgi:hypothetical protein